MNRFLFLLIVFSNSLFAQNNCGGLGIILNSQEQVDSFAINYPSHNHIVGNLKIISEGSHITNLNGLNQILSIDGCLTIELNTQLTSLEGLENLTHIGASIELKSNELLENLEGLSGLQQLDNSLIINNCPQIINLNGLQGLTKIGRSLDIQHCDAFENFAGLENIDTIVGKLGVQWSSNFTTFEHLESLQFITRIDLQFSDQLENLNGLENIETLTNQSLIGHCSKLKDLSGLENLRFVEGRLYIRNNPQLENISHLSNLERVSEQLHITDCPSITSISPLHNLMEVAQLKLINLSISNMNGLENLDLIGRLSISNNNELENLEGLNNLTSILGGLLISNNPILNNIEALQKLTNIESFTIVYNEKLSSLWGIHHVDTTNLNYIGIHDNSVLEICNFDNICAYVKNSGWYDIESNGITCNSAVDILQQCEITNPISLTVTVIPNPITDFLTVESTSLLPIEFHLYNAIGQQILATHFTESTTIDFRQFPSGIYFFTFQLNGETQTKKVIKAN